jgi:signal peptidase
MLPTLSGSMRPTMPVGSITIAQREPLSDLRLHDVAVFHPPFSTHVIYMHRVVSLQRTPQGFLIHTKGDANRTPDPWTLKIDSKDIYIVRGSVPYAGYVIVWIHSRFGRAIILTVAGLIAVALVASVIIDSNKKKRKGGHDDVIIDLRDEKVATNIAPAATELANAPTVRQPG